MLLLWWCWVLMGMLWRRRLLLGGGGGRGRLWLVLRRRRLWLRVRVGLPLGMCLLRIASPRRPIGAVPPDQILRSASFPLGRTLHLSITRQRGIRRLLGRRSPRLLARSWCLHSRLRPLDASRIPVRSLFRSP